MQADPPVMTMKAQQEKLRDEEIWGFVCNSCKHEQFGPMVRCQECGKRDIGTRKFSNRGKIVSYTIQTVAAEAFLNETPFAYAIVDLDDGPKIACWVPWISKSPELPIGQQVEFIPSYKPGIMFEKY